MPTNHTENYQLSQWVKSDQVRMEDFNADNAKIDAALAAQAGTLAAHTEALAGKGNCRVVWGSYTGNNLAGPSHPTSLTFDGKPLAVFIMSDFNASNTYTPLMVLIQGVPWGKSATQGHNFVTWTENGVSWYNYNNNAGSPQDQMTNGTHHYFALLAADE